MYLWIPIYPIYPFYLFANIQIKIRKVCHTCVSASICKLISSYINPFFLDIRNLLGNIREINNVMKTKKNTWVMVGVELFRSLKQD